MQETRDTIVVGGGIAGCTAAMYSIRYGLDVVALEMMAPGGQASTATTIENYPGFPEGIQGPELAVRVHQQAANAGVEFITTEAIRIERTEGDLWTLYTNGGDMEAISVIIATGAFPRSLMVPGEKELRGHGVSYCATCDGFFYRGRTVAVVGGGNSAIEEALYLADIAEKVYAIHRRDELRADDYLQKRILERPNVEVLWNSVVSEIHGEQAVESLKLQDTQTGESTSVQAEGLFIAVGHIAKTEWLHDALELKQGFIVTDQLMRTSQPGVFACGDIRDTPLRQIATAGGDAAIAAFSAHSYVVHRKSELLEGV